MKAQRDKAIREELMGLGAKMGEAMKINQEQGQELQATQEALKIVKDENEVNKKNLKIYQGKFQDLQAQMVDKKSRTAERLIKCQEIEAENKKLKEENELWRKQQPAVVEQQTLKEYMKMAEEEKAKLTRELKKAVLRGEYDAWRERCAFQCDLDEEGRFLLDNTDDFSLAHEIFEEMNGMDCGDECIWVLDTPVEGYDGPSCSKRYMDDEGEYTLTEGDWEEKQDEE